MATHSSPSNPDTDQVLLEVLEAVADARNEDITSLSPISDAFDPDALERFLQSTTVPTTVRLDIYGCQIEIDGDGAVTVVAG